MTIDTTMLMLSAANPGLLPLAFSGGNAPYTSSYSGTMRHKHSVEHSVKKGTGEELRGVAVDPQRAARAFASALLQIEEATVKHEQDIVNEEKAIEAAIQEHRKEIAEKQAKQTRKELEYTQNKERIAFLKAKQSSKFWGLDGFDKAELNRLEEEVSRYKIFRSDGVFDSWMDWYDYGYYSPHYPRPSIKTLTDSIQEIHAQCCVAINCQHLSPDWAKKMYYIEQGAMEWVMQQAPFNKYGRAE